MRLTHFGGTALPTASETVDTPIEARVSLVELRDGAFDENGQALVLRPVTITRSFKVTSTLTTTLDALLTKFAQGRKLLRAIKRDDATYVQTWAKVAKVSRPRARGDKNYQQMDVSFVQDYPFWTARADDPTYLDDGEVLDAGWYLDGNQTTFVLSADTVTGTITNNGTVPIRKGRLHIVPRSGASFTGLRITNTTNGMYFDYAGTVAEPDVLEIDFLSLSAKKTYLTNVYAGISIPSGQMDLMQLEVGANSISIAVTGRSGTTDLYWQWSKHYL